MKIRFGEEEWWTLRVMSTRWRVLFVLWTVLIGMSAVRGEGGPAACEEGEFSCQSGVCVPLSKHNNSVNDCGDNSDEVRVPCRYPAFSCKNTNCVVMDWVLDGRNDCKDGSDEAKLIGTSCLMVMDCCYCSDYVLHSECLMGTCQCSSGFYNNTLGTACIRRVVGDACLSHEDCYDAFNNSHCDDGLCTCDTGYYANEEHSMCVRRLVGDSCAVHVDCTTLILNSNCTGKTCVCNSGYYHSPDKRTCIKRKLEDSCKYSHDCAGAMPNTVCLRRLVMQFNVTTGTEKVCTCAHGYDELTDKTGCDVRKIGEGCLKSKDCVIPASKCHSEKHECVCKGGHYPSRRRDKCVRNIIGDPCESNRNCTAVIQNSHCLSTMCVCQMGFKDVGDGTKCENRDTENIAIIAGSIVAIGTLVIIDVTLIVLIFVHFVI